jgi:hypothetical protein
MAWSNEWLKSLEAQLEIMEDKEILRDLGLTEEEIEGYIEFFADDFFPASSRENIILN